MGLTGAVVADNKQSFVVDGLIKLKLRDNEIDKLLGHFIRNDIGIHKLTGGSGFVGIPQLNHRLDRLKLDQVTVFHVFVSNR